MNLCIYVNKYTVYKSKSISLYIYIYKYCI